MRSHARPIMRFLMTPFLEGNHLIRQARMTHNHCCCRMHARTYVDNVRMAHIDRPEI